MIKAIECKDEFSSAAINYCVVVGQILDQM